MARMRLRSGVLAAQLASALQCRPVSRGMRLAGPEHLPAQPLVLGSDGSGAGQSQGADIDHQIGVGAHERQLQRHALLDKGPVVLHRLGAVVPQAGADDGLGLGKRDVRAGQAHVEGVVPLAGSHPVHAPVALRGDMVERDVAGGDDGVPGIAAHAGLLQHALHAGRGDRRIGDEDHRSALGAEARQSRAGLRVGAPAVVHHAPHIAEDGVVARQQRPGVGDDRRRHGFGEVVGLV